MADIAVLLKTPESTVRSHCHRFKEFIPSTGEGREKRYLNDAITVLRTVAECYGNNMTTRQIKDHLAREYPMTIDADTEQQQLTVQQQRDTVTQQQLLTAQQQTAAMLMLAIQTFGMVVEEVKQVNEKLDRIEKQQSATDQKITEWRESKKKKPSIWTRLVFWR